jgi:hypothetical protein
MKFFISFLLSIFISVSCFSQYFEGEIVYRNSYKSKISGLSDEKFTSLMGSNQEYFIKGAEYRSNTNGDLLQWQIYVPSENKMYTKMANNEAALWNDTGNNQDSVISIEMNKKVITILGYTCDELILICKSGTQKYYFNSKLAIDSKKFVNHKFGNWYTFVSNSNALPLKIDIENKQFNMNSTAVEVKPMRLEDSMFQLPQGIKSVQGPY